MTSINDLSIQEIDLNRAIFDKLDPKKLLKLTIKGLNDDIASFFHLLVNLRSLKFCQTELTLKNFLLLTEMKSLAFLTV